MSPIPFSDWLHPGIEKRYDSDELPMGATAERVAREHDVGREEQDRFALRSHRWAIDAWEEGRFDDEVVPVDADDPLERDEGPRPETSLEDLADLPTVFADDEAATVTPGNASPLTDGAAGLFVTSPEYASRNDLDVLATVRSRAVAGVDPRVMEVGPVPATRAALETAGINVGDLDLVELNEAFASQSLYCKRALGSTTTDSPSTVARSCSATCFAVRALGSRRRCCTNSGGRTTGTASRRCVSASGRVWRRCSNDRRERVWKSTAHIYDSAENVSPCETSISSVPVSRRSGRFRTRATGTCSRRPTRPPATASITELIPETSTRPSSARSASAAASSACRGRP
ncbi:acetyl-CoA acetyltransferase [Natronobacterium gregoryi SP2]|uniref:Acetyl-CoA acetyltransferase n=1 Tax=Natronobacterium gregoryi (strain ATCC 43098 / DSM 3393 / CCM 3738 / CIP 104747 / IAM 13177 / JCM 8860 / NBRC 102187 / NCIMB 2189 / SP2) TaxID=797304 RepID=L9YJL3_NATGS|nr:acetyl-CoA acetyltransferase [Natronobacterium gregoryi SP2]